MGRHLERNRSLGFLAGVEGGGGYISCIMGNVKMVNLKTSRSCREQTASEFR